MDLSRLAELKKRLHEATKFSEVFDFFLTNFGEVDEFMQLGEAVREDDFIRVVIREVCKSLFQQPMILVTGTLVRIAEHQFIHGALTLGKYPASIIYFEDVHKGLLVVPWSLNPPETKFMRFTGRALYDSLNRSQN